MAERLPHHVVFLNGLGRPKVGTPEMSIFRYLRSKNVDMTPAAIDWHSNLTFQEIFDRATEFAEQKIRQKGRIALIGASAGGSLGVNVVQRLRSSRPDSDVSLVTLSGRLRVGDRRNLINSALNALGRQPSPAYVESVLRCDESAIPKLSDLDKQFVRTVHPSSDEEVPLDTMGIEGVESYPVRAIGHIPGIARGILLVPEILDNIYKPKE